MLVRDIVSRLKELNYIENIHKKPGGMLKGYHVMVIIVSCKKVTLFAYHGNMG